MLDVYNGSEVTTCQCNVLLLANMPLRHELHGSFYVLAPRKSTGEALRLGIVAHTEPCHFASLHYFRATSDRTVYLADCGCYHSPVQYTAVVCRVPPLPCISPHTVGVTNVGYTLISE
jgi:hypothetical protein